MREFFPAPDGNMMPAVSQRKNIFILGAGGVTSSIIDALQHEWVSYLLT